MDGLVGWGDNPGCGATVGEAIMLREHVIKKHVPTLLSIAKGAQGLRESVENAKKEMENPTIIKGKKMTSMLPYAHLCKALKDFDSLLP